MGEWQEVKSPDEREQYVRLLASVHEVYSRTNVKGMNRLLDGRDGRAFIYTETSPRAFHIFLCMTPVYGDPLTWKIVNAVPLGDYEPKQAIIITGRQVRRIADEVGATSCYGRPLKDYGDSQMNEFYRAAPDLYWEFDAEEESSHGKLEYKFRRAGDRKEEDELFVGPRSRGPQAHEIPP